MAAHLWQVKQCLPIFLQTSTKDTGLQDVSRIFVSVHRSALWQTRLSRMNFAECRQKLIENIATKQKLW